MQTFLPYPNFYKSAEALDNKRLGKQRVEAYQILNILLHLKKHPRAKKAWMNHPAVLMWKGYEGALAQYGYAMCLVWRERGYKDSLALKFAKRWFKTSILERTYPIWIGSKKLHQSHRSNLLRKDPKHYRKLWPKLRNDLPYVWPVRKSNS